MESGTRRARCGRGRGRSNSIASARRLAALPRSRRARAHAVARAPPAAPRLRRRPDPASERPLPSRNDGPAPPPRRATTGLPHEAALTKIAEQLDHEERVPVGAVVDQASEIGREAVAAE